MKETKKDTANPKYRVRTISLAGNLSMISYIDKFPLFSSKQLNYLDWAYVVHMMERGAHLTDLGRMEVGTIKAGMNDNRSIFLWDHLQKFYILDS